MKIQTIDLSRLRHAEFIQFIRQTTEIISNNDPAVLKVVTQYNNLKNQLDALEELHKRSLASKLTTELEQLDKLRDNALVAIGFITNGYTYASDISLKNAALLINNSISIYGTAGEIARLNYNAQTATVISLLNEWETNTKISEAIKTLNLTGFVTELKTVNTTFNTKYQERIVEYGGVNPTTLKEVRLATLPIYYSLREILEAYQIIEDSEEGNTTIKHLNALIEQYNNLLLLRATKNGNSGTTDDTTADILS